LVKIKGLCVEKRQEKHQTSQQVASLNLTPFTANKSLFSAYNIFENQIRIIFLPSEILVADYIVARLQVVLERPTK